MNDTFQANRRPPRFEWWRFFIVAAIVVGIFGTFIRFTLSPRGEFGVIVTMVVFAASLLGFFGFRWHRLRAAVAAGTLNSQDFYADPQAHILGPKRALRIWFACTIVAIIGITVCSALSSR